MKGVGERHKIWKKTKEGAAWYKEYSIDRFRRIRIEAIMKLGGCCKSCGYKDIRALHIDHVNGDGKAERGIRKTIYNRIVADKTDISRYQLLCANCNWIKRLEQNEGSNRKDYNQFMLTEMKKIKSKPVPLDISTQHGKRKGRG